ncbi:hypothetical protein SASPL_120776 [Salvia splendens]|uniref:Uncharacterized protein n=1 Tax=Salvia splendens TaxID=180675 RepID=A0A8X8ZVI1_SALSN|nr:hypothetical protein SASPL_120776 [Salvia splendens]
MGSSAGSACASICGSVLDALRMELDSGEHLRRGADDTHALFHRSAGECEVCEPCLEGWGTNVCVRPGGSSCDSDMGPPSARLKEQQFPQEDELNADTRLPATRQHAEPVRRERSSRRVARRPARYEG